MIGYTVDRRATWIAPSQVNFEQHDQHIKYIIKDNTKMRKNIAIGKTLFFSSKPNENLNSPETTFECNIAHKFIK